MSASPSGSSDPKSPSASMVRKTHTKSRKGCQQCKRRHVKCDETQPRCAACSRLDIVCTWAAPKTSTTSLTPPPSTPGSAAGAQAGASTPAGPWELDMESLKLLHFWTTHTSFTPAVKAEQIIYQTVMVELGFKYPFLLHAILAVSAIHKAVLGPANNEDLVYRSTCHMDVAVSELRRQIAFPDPVACSAVFGCAGLVVMHSLGLCQANPPKDPLGEMCHWIRLVHGSKATVQQNWIRLITSDMAPIVFSVDWSKTSGGDIQEIMDLETLIGQMCPKDSPAYDAHFKAIERLHVVFKNTHYYLRSGELNSVAITMSWVACLEDTWVNLVEERDPVALIIVAHFAVLMRLHEKTWFWKGWSRWTLDAIVTQLHEDYRPWIAWPIRQLQNGLEPTSDMNSPVDRSQTDTAMT